MTRVTLLLARSPEFPEGDITDRLILNLVLNSQGQLDAEAYHDAPQPWLATHDRRGGTPRSLEIVRLDEGWALQNTDNPDDPIWSMDGHVFRPGDLVRLGRPDGAEVLFRIVSSEAVPRET